MTTVLQYLVIAAVIGGVVFALAVFVFGRGEQLAALPARTSPTELPDTGMTGQDVRTVRFAMALRGYRMSDVDWALERMATELDVLRARLADREPVPVGSATVAAPNEPGPLNEPGPPNEYGTPTESGSPAQGGLPNEHGLRDDLARRRSAAGSPPAGTARHVEPFESTDPAPAPGDLE